MITRIILMRHGRTEWNVDNRWQGQAPIPLDIIGRTQAHLAGQHLASAALDRIFTSDLIRAVQTAQLVGDYVQVPITPDARLREIHVGTWQGLTSEEVQLWDAERYAVVKADPINTRRPQGESWADVAERVRTALEEYVAQYTGQGLLVVTHGGVIRIILKTLGVSIDTNFTNENAALTELHHEAEKWSLVTLGETAHLADL